MTSAGEPERTAAAPADSGPDTPVEILGVPYRHRRTYDGGDLYVTRHGWPLLDLLLPVNWYEAVWFRENRERLVGSSTVYRVATRTVNGRRADLVVKWSRVGEQVPMDTFALNRFAEAEFNSPYEEFALLEELRASRMPGPVRTHRPLAIYVPAKRLDLWQTGRNESRIARKKAKHRDVELDIFRQYILIYEWIKGVSVIEAVERMEMDGAARARLAEEMTLRAIADLAHRGFRVLDMKPAHVIVRPRADAGGRLLRERDGRIAYALVDFELLERTPEHESEVARRRRGVYLKKQRDRFGVESESFSFPSHLQPARVLGVDYVHGATESTGGELWVVGRDPGLFDYFQPERWRRTPRTNLSTANEVWRTRTKDDINIVWRVSRVGERPEGDAYGPRGARVLAYGFNSPFEEFAYALRLAQAGVPTVYPRAIYMSGLQSERPDYVQDPRRYVALREERTAAGDPVLRPNRIYVAIWGFWNGRDELLAARDATYCTGIDLEDAVRKGLLSADRSASLLEWQRQRMGAAGFEDLNLKPDHLLLSLDPDNRLILDEGGRPEIRICNMELVAPTGGDAATGRD